MLTHFVLLFAAFGKTWLCTRELTILLRVALRDVKRYMKEEASISRMPFHRLVRDTTRRLYPEKPFRFALSTLLAIQEACEAHISHIQDASCDLKIHRSSVSYLSWVCPSCRARYCVDDPLLTTDRQKSPVQAVTLIY